MTPTEARQLYRQLKAEWKELRTWWEKAQIGAPSYVVSDVESDIRNFKERELYLLRILHPLTPLTPKTLALEERGLYETQENSIN